MARRHGERKEDAARRKDRERRDLEKAIQAVDNDRATQRDRILYQRAVASSVSLPGNSLYDYASSSITRLPDRTWSNRDWADAEFARKTAQGIGAVVVPAATTDAYTEDQASDTKKEPDEPIARKQNDISVQLKRPFWREKSEADPFKGTIFLVDGKSGESFVHIDPWRIDEDFQPIRLTPFVPRTLTQLDPISVECNLAPASICESPSVNNGSNNLSDGEVVDPSVFVQDAAFVLPRIEARRFGGTHNARRSTEPRPVEQVAPWNPHKLAGIIRWVEVKDPSRPLDDFSGREHSGRRERLG